MCEPGAGIRCCDGLVRGGRPRGENRAGICGNTRAITRTDPRFPGYDSRWLVVGPPERDVPSRWPICAGAAMSADDVWPDGETVGSFCVTPTVDPWSLYVTPGIAGVRWCA
jgi:hypothetical protein